MTNKQIAREWFKIADMDLIAAEFLWKMRPVPIEIICYHCQQSGEKYLKGFLAFKGESIRKTHDLVLLSKLCQPYDREFKTLLQDCLTLTDYGVNVRYPFPIDIDETDLALAIESAHKIKDFVLQKVSTNK